jgi:hypothetical protein
VNGLPEIGTTAWLLITVLARALRGGQSGPKVLRVQRSSVPARRIDTRSR